MTSSVNSSIVPLPDDVPGIENGKSLRDVPDEIQALLHEQHRAGPLGKKALDHLLYLLHDRGLQPFGGLIEKKQLRLLHERLRDRELLLLSAGQDAALSLGDVSQRRKVVEDEARQALAVHALPE